MKLNVEIRNIIGKNVKKLRREGKIPATVYSKHLESSISILCDKNEFVKLYKNAWQSTPVTLIGEWIEELVLIHNFQLDPVTDVVIHVDFLGIKKGVKVSAEVEIIMEWEEVSPIVKSGDATIQLIKDSLAIIALPKDLPRNIVVDVSNIDDVNTVIFVKDLELPEGVEVEDDLELPVVTIMDLKKSAAEEEAREEQAEAQQTVSEETESSIWNSQE